MALWYVLAICLTIAIGALIFRLRLTRRTATVSSLPQPVHQAEADNKTANTPDRGPAGIAFQTEATANTHSALLKIAFGIGRFDYRILGGHVRVLREAEEAVANIMNDPRHFPRKPTMLPKLLRAINAQDSSRSEIVRLILQDPMLAGNVLKRANSAFYRTGNAPVESVDRAVAILGSEGLRAPVASAVMQPVFQLPRGFFEQFAPVVWEQAQRAAMAAETFARTDSTIDPFVAHLLGLLGGLGNIVLFRMTMDKYRKQGHIMPRAEVFVRVIMEHGRQVTRAIAQAWDMSASFLEALDAQIKETSPTEMTPLARTLYYANLIGTLATLSSRGQCSAESAQELLIAQGLDANVYVTVWSMATESNDA